METVVLHDREIVELFPHPTSPIRGFGVSLDNEEAQDLIAKGYRVFCDEGGPYLVVRLRSGRKFPIFLDPKHVDIKIAPTPWLYHNLTGVICWFVASDIL